MSEPAHGISPEQTEQDTPKKKRGIVFLLRIIAVIAALLAVAGLAIPQLRKSSALGAVGERVLAEMTPFSVAVSYYSGEDLSRLSQKQDPTDAGYRKMAQLFEQIRILQGYDRLYLLCRDGERQLFYLGDGQPFPIGSYKPLKTILDRIYTGKSTGAYAKDLITREDGKKAAASCIPLYGNGRTVLAVLVVEADPGNTNYHLVGPINLHLVGLVSGALLLVCLLLLWLIRKRRLARHNARRRQSRPRNRLIRFLPADSRRLPPTNRSRTPSPLRLSRLAGPARHHNIRSRHPSPRRILRRLTRLTRRYERLLRRRLPRGGADSPRQGGDLRTDRPALRKAARFPCGGMGAASKSPARNHPLSSGGQPQGGNGSCFRLRRPAGTARPP